MYVLRHLKCCFFNWHLFFVFFFKAFGISELLPNSAKSSLGLLFSNVIIMDDCIRILLLRKVKWTSSARVVGLHYEKIVICGCMFVPFFHNF